MNILCVESFMDCGKEFYGVFSWNDYNNQYERGLSLVEREASGAHTAISRGPCEFTALSVHSTEEAAYKEMYKRKRAITSSLSEVS